MIVLLVVVVSVEAVRRPRSLFTGLGAGLITGIYDYAGYNPTAYMGAELKNPGRVMPRSIIYSIMAIIALYWRCRSCRGCPALAGDRQVDFGDVARGHPQLEPHRG